MSDIIERAEAFLADRGADLVHADRIVRGLLAALKAAHTENEQLLATIRCHQSGQSL